MVSCTGLWGFTISSRPLEQESTNPFSDYLHLSIFVRVMIYPSLALVFVLLKSSQLTFSTRVLVFFWLPCLWPFILSFQ
jgi:hypothetical protein